MTLERILQAAINSMINGHHVPHCYSAHVPGQGYVNDGTIESTRADYLAQLKRTATSEVENMGYAEGYAEPGYEQPKRGVLLANWNHLPRGLDDILERAGYAVEWSDEWAVCDGCNKAVRTEPNGYDWQPSYRIEHGEIVCLGCAEEDASEETEGAE